MPRDVHILEYKSKKEPAKNVYSQTLGRLEPE